MVLTWAYVYRTRLIQLLVTFECDHAIRCWRFLILSTLNSVCVFQIVIIQKLWQPSGISDWSELPLVDRCSSSLLYFTTRLADIPIQRLFTWILQLSVPSHLICYLRWFFSSTSWCYYSACHLSGDWHMLSILVSFFVRSYIISGIILDITISVASLWSFQFQFDEVPTRLTHWLLCQLQSPSSSEVNKASFPLPERKNSHYYVHFILWYVGWSTVICLAYGLHGHMDNWIELGSFNCRLHVSLISLVRCGRFFVSLSTMWI